MYAVKWLDEFMKDSENYGIAVTGERLSGYISFLRRTFPEDAKNVRR